MLIHPLKNSNFIKSSILHTQIRTMALELTEREVHWWGLRPEQREELYTVGFTQSYPGNRDEAAEWTDWYINYFTAKRPKTFFKKWFYILFLESWAMYYELWTFQPIKYYMDLRNDPYNEYFVDELLDQAHETHIDVFGCWQHDNWHYQYGFYGIPWIINFIFWDYVFEEWHYTECMIVNTWGFFTDLFTKLIALV
jgi:hypothetical protein